MSRVFVVALFVFFSLVGSVFAQSKQVPQWKIGRVVYRIPDNATFSVPFGDLEATELTALSMELKFRFYLFLVDQPSAVSEEESVRLTANVIMDDWRRKNTGSIDNAVVAVLRPRSAAFHLVLPPSFASPDTAAEGFVNSFAQEARKPERNLYQEFVRMLIEINISLLDHRSPERDAWYERLQRLKAAADNLAVARNELFIETAGLVDFLADHSVLMGNKTYPNLLKRVVRTIYTEDVGRIKDETQWIMSTRKELEREQEERFAYSEQMRRERDKQDAHDHFILKLAAVTFTVTMTLLIVWWLIARRRAAQEEASRVAT